MPSSPAQIVEDRFGRIDLPRIESATENFLREDGRLSLSKDTEFLANLDRLERVLVEVRLVLGDQRVTQRFQCLRD
jgi:hypothetical protein